MRGATGWISMALAWLALSSCIAPPYAEVTDCADDYVETPSEYAIEAWARAGMVKQEEHSFVCYATVLDRAQLQSARLAQERAMSPAVKRVAATTIAEQEVLDRRLGDIAEQHEGVIPPHGLDEPHLAMLDQLKSLSGEAFDRAYLEDRLREEEATIAVLRQELAEGSEPILRRFALDTLPLVEERLRETQSLIDRSG
jgi:putative membrane protein